MKTYLTYINPIVCLIVLVGCFWASTYDGKDGFHLIGIFVGSFSTYFFIKGIFCSSALFILGRMLLIMQENKKS